MIQNYGITMIKFSTAILILFTSNLSYAGSCACNKDICPSLEIKFAKSEAVFLAEIISAKPVEGDGNNYRPIHKIKLSIKEIFKGSPFVTKIAYARHVPFDANLSISSDIEIGVGTRYIIFKRSKEDVKLSLCPTYYEHVTDKTINFLRNKSVLQ